MIIEPLDYIHFDQEQFDALCATDPVLLRYEDRRRELEESLAKWAAEENNARRLVNETQDLLDSLEGQVKAADRRLRELRGQVRSWIATQGTVKTRLTDNAKSRARRERELYHMEVTRRLRAMGKDIKRGVRNIGGQRPVGLRIHDLEQHPSTAEPLSGQSEEANNTAPSSGHGEDVAG